LLFDGFSYSIVFPRFAFEARMRGGAFEPLPLHPSLEKPAFAILIQLSAPWAEFLTTPLFRRKISRQEGLGATIPDSLDP